MFCLHKRKLVVSSETNGRTTMLESKKVLTKITKVYFCPDCNRNITGKYLK